MLGSNEAWKLCRWRNGSETLLSKTMKNVI